MTNRYRLSILAVAALAASVFLTAAPARAVTTVTVTDDQGQAVAGASVSLGGQTGQTDDQGQVTFQGVTPGRQELSITGEGTKTVTRQVDVPAGNSNIPVTVKRWFAWRTQSPPAGSVGAGPNYEGTFIDSLTIRRSLLRDFVGGGSVFTVQPVPNLEREVDVSMSLNEALVDVPLGLPSIDAGPCLRISPAISFALGGNSVTVEQDGPGSQFDTKVSGSGFSWGAGGSVGFSVPPHGEHRWMENLTFGLRYNYRDGSADVERSPRGSEIRGFNPVPAATQISEDGDLDWHAHKAGVYVGYNLFGNRATPYLGLQYEYRRVSLETNNVVDVFGTTVRRQVTQEFKYSELAGVVGLDARPFGGISGSLDPLFLRTELSFNGDSVGAQVKLVYQFDLFDW